MAAARSPPAACSIRSRRSAKITGRDTGEFVRGASLSCRQPAESASCFARMPESEAQLAVRRRTRQKITVTLLAVFMITMGVLLIFVLKRAPMPMRVIGGLGNLTIGSVLLMLVRQKFRG